MIFIKFLKCTLLQKIVIVVQSCTTLCEPMNCSMPGFPVLFYLPEFAGTTVWEGHSSHSAVDPLGAGLGRAGGRVTWQAHSPVTVDSP